MKSGKLNIVFGGQAGSEAKGKQAAYLADKFRITNFACNLSPNAGHTVVKDGEKIVTHHIPVGIVGSPDREETLVVLGPASVINVDLFLEEVKMLVEKGVVKKASQIVVDERASIITKEHVKEEVETMVKIGSTAQGVGLARMDRIMRRGMRIKDVKDLLHHIGVRTAKETSVSVIRIMEEGGTFLYEMGQGFDLCLDHGVDPVYCTSRNCTPMQALADMGVPVKWMGDTYAVIRPYPIRVNNRTGTSGPYPSPEIAWEEVRKRCGAPEELTEITTTTRLPRRVFEWSDSQIETMIKICDPTYICLQFVNYIEWEMYEKTHQFEGESIHINVWKRITNINDMGKMVAYLGTGPEHAHMIDMGVDN
jgi:adenylosuccinate synthase